MRSHQRGQAIVLVALILTALFGFLGLAIDGGRGYLDRRHVQASVDAAALGAAYDYMNHSDYGEAELAGVNQFATNERLYDSPTCGGYGTLLVSCSFTDPTQQSLTIAVADHSIAGVTFTATATHHIGISVMQVLGFGPTIRVGATATAVARRAGQNGAAIQTLSPALCNGTAGNSLTFTGTSTTSVTGDIWSNGSITDNGSAGGSVNGNVIDICPNQPPTALPNFTVSGTQANGFNIPDPDYPQPALDPNARTWGSTSGSTELAGTYAADPHLTNSSGCYFLAGGVYDFAGGLSQNGGFISNVLRPPDEPVLSANGVPNITTLSATITAGSRPTSVSVSALPGAVPSGAQLVMGSETFTTSATANAGDTTVFINRPGNGLPATTVASGAIVTIRANPQFWDSNGVGCSSSFALSSPGSGSLAGGSYSVVVTAVRWQANGVPSCSGPISPTCYYRETAPSMCRTIDVATSGNIKVQVTADPGATDFNVYVAQNGNCSGLAYCTDTGAGSFSVVIPNCTPGGASPPDYENLPVGPGLPNSDPPPATPPRGDMANAAHCVNPSTGFNVSCPSGWTVGAVEFFIPGGGSTSVCLNLQGGGDIYIYSGYQYQRILLFEPGPEQPAPANTCLNNVAGHGITSLIGIFYVPAASVTIIGSSSFLATIAGGVISWTATIKGNGGVSIIADPTLRTWPSAVRLTQ